MKRGKLSKLFLLTAIISIICLIAAWPVASGLESKYLRGRQKVTEHESLDKYLSGLVSKDEPGLAAAVIKNGQPAMIIPHGTTCLLPAILDTFTLQPAMPAGQPSRLLVARQP